MTSLSQTDPQPTLIFYTTYFHKEERALAYQLGQDLYDSALALFGAFGGPMAEPPAGE